VHRILCTSYNALKTRRLQERFRGHAIFAAENCLAESSARAPIRNRRAAVVPPQLVHSFRFQKVSTWDPKIRIPKPTQHCALGCVLSELLSLR